MAKVMLGVILLAHSPHPMLLAGAAGHHLLVAHALLAALAVRAALVRLHPSQEHYFIMPAVAAALPIYRVERVASVASAAAAQVILMVMAILACLAPAAVVAALHKVRPAAMAAAASLFLAIRGTLFFPAALFHIVIGKRFIHLRNPETYPRL